MGPPFTGHFRVILDTPRGLQSLHPGTRPSAQNGIAGTSAKPHPPLAPGPLEIRTNIYQTTAKASRSISEAEAANLTAQVDTTGRSISYSCDTCGVDCTAVRYHSLKVKNFELCPPCYLDGRFPSSMFSGDFVKLTSANASAGLSTDEDDWSDQEILLLLEGVEMFEDDWSAIEEHVGTRTAHQCIRKFLELPIEDPFLERESEALMGPLRYARVPFEKADNPVMSVVAFLAGVVPPGPAADAAKTALKELTDEPETKAKEKGTIDSAADVEMADNNKTTDVVAPKLESSPGVSGENEKPIARSRAARAADLAFKTCSRAASTVVSDEEAHIRSTLTKLVQLTLTKLELKMTHFDEMEELLEEERRNLETSRVALVAERQNIKRVLENIRSEMARNGSAATLPHDAYQSAVDAGSQGTKVVPVAPDMPLQGEMGPISEGTYQQLT